MQKTTLILGAGFSMPYGYPSGKQLIGLLMKSGSQWNENELKNFKEHLEDNDPESIDAFLNEYKQLHDFGLYLIAEQFLKIERMFLNNPKSDEQLKELEHRDILKHLINNLKEEDFDKFNIITFNYDRHLEWKLYRKLLSKYKAKKQAMLALAKLRIIHVHGEMAPFCQFDKKGIELKKTDWVPYGLDLRETTEDRHSPQIYQGIYTGHAIKNMKTIYTNVEMKTEIQEMIQEATRVFFLGFGYDETNMKLLGITQENVQLNSPYAWSKKTVAGTMLGLQTIDKNKILRLFPFLQNEKLKNTDCKTMFTEYFSLNFPGDDNGIRMNVDCCLMSAAQQNLDNEKLIKDKHGVITCDFKCQTCKRVVELNLQRNTVHSSWNRSIKQKSVTPEKL